MTERVGAYDRSQFAPDELMAEVFLKPSSAIIGPGGTVVLPRWPAMSTTSANSAQ